MPRTVIATDDFQSYTDNTFPSTNWTDLDNFNGQIRVFGTTAKAVRNAFSGAYSTMRRSAGTYSADQYAEVAILGLSGTETSDKIGVTCRNTADAAPNDDCYMAYVDDIATRTCRLERLINGTRTPLTTDTATTWTAGDRVSMEVTGTGATVSIKVFKNNVEITAMAYSDTSVDRITAAGRPGVMCFTDGGNNLTGDDWEGGDMTAGGASSILRQMMNYHGG